MKNWLYLLFFALLLAQTASAADTGAAEIKKGFASYFSMMDQMQAQVSKVRDAKGTAKLLDDWVRANEILLATTAKYAKQYPEAVSTKTPPPELAEEMQKVADAKFTYGSLTSDLGVLVKTFESDPAVKAAVERRRKTMKTLHDNQADSKTPTS